MCVVIFLCSVNRDFPVYNIPNPVHPHPNNHYCTPSPQHPQGAPLLLGGDHDADNRILLNMSTATEHLPTLTITDSSEAMLPGRKSTFRLMVCAVDAQDGTPLDVRPLLSPPFVVCWWGGVRGVLVCVGCVGGIVNCVL